VEDQNTKHKAQSTMYRRPRFLEVLHSIREEMSREADYDVDLFAEMVRSGQQPTHGPERIIRGFRTRAPRVEKESSTKNKRRQRKRTA
jgi:hypothetical protein